VRPADATRDLASTSPTATIRAACREIAKTTPAGAPTVLRGERRRARTGIRGGLIGHPDARCLMTAEEAHQATAGPRTRVRGTGSGGRGRAEARHRPAASMITQRATEEESTTTCAAGRASLPTPPIRTATMTTTTATGRSVATGVEVAAWRRAAATLETTTTATMHLATGAGTRLPRFAAALQASHAAIRATQTRGSTGPGCPACCFALLACVATAAGRPSAVSPP